jgi:hypothetical protein
MQHAQPFSYFFSTLLNKTYPFKVEEILLEGLSCLSVDRLVSDVWILLVATAFIIFTTVSLPITQTHPTEIKFTLCALLQRITQGFIFVQSFFFVK